MFNLKLGTIFVKLNGVRVPIEVDVDSLRSALPQEYPPVAKSPKLKSPVGEPEPKKSPRAQSYSPDKSRSSIRFHSQPPSESRVLDESGEVHKYPREH